MLRSIFNFWFSVEELITVQVTKVPRGEDLSAEVPRRGGEGRGRRLKGGERVLVLVVLVHAALISGLTWPGQVCAAKQVVDF